MRKPQGVASLALGWVLHWAFSPHLLNPKLEYVIYCCPAKRKYAIGRKQQTQALNATTKRKQQTQTANSSIKRYH